jgi:DNA-binding LacI/PurR family transcriptional regulator
MGDIKKLEENSRRKITIYDVAKHAGVSPGTVSRTLNEIGYIKQDTRDKVLRSVEALQYIPNMAGRTLKTTKTRMICLAIPDTSNPIYFRMIESTLKVAKQNGYSLLLFYTNGKEEGELKAVRILQESTVDALFLVHFSYSNRLRSAIESCLQPIALCGMCSHMWTGPANMRNFDTLSINVFNAIYSSASYLMKKGHKEIVYLAGKQGIEVYFERYRAFKQALMDNGLEYHEESVFWYGYDEEAGYAAGKHYLSQDRLPTAVCASNDLQIIGFFRACKEAAIRIPQEIELVGLDNLELTELLGISSINMHEAEIGRKATEFLFLRMKEGFSNLPPQDFRMEPNLVLR